MSALDGIEDDILFEEEQDDFLHVDNNDFSAILTT